VLGFVGLPTLGFYLETAFGEGIYSEAAALLFIFYILIATLKVWMKPKLIGLYLLAAPFALATADTTPVNFDNIVRFFSQDIVPHPLRGQGWMDAGVLSNFGDWVSMLWVDQAVPGIIATVLLTQIALVASGMLTLVFFPLVSKKFFGTFGRTLGHGFLVVVRSTPEFILAYVFLQLWGPSMLPAIVALALHNGAIMGHLVGRYSDNVQLRPDSPKGLNLYGYEIVPRVYGQFLAFLFYRWEVIMRETTILGILGIATLGFFIDSGLQDIRLDRALFFIIITAFLNIGVDILSRNIRARLRLSAKVEQT
jgi:phosphonate transport system permease protein